MEIQWFPGHMAHAKEVVSKNLMLVDAVIEVLDARIPLSSKNPDIDKILKQKPKIIVFNKEDLADEKVSMEWSKWYKARNCKIVFVDSIRGKGINSLKLMLKEITKDKIEKEKHKGKVFRPIRTMAVGIPNVSKSSLINIIAGKSKAATEDKPGTTMQKQWIRLGDGIEILDTPGILWPKFSDREVGINLAITGAIKDSIFDNIEVAARLMAKLNRTYPEFIKSRYKLDINTAGSSNIINNYGDKTVNILLDNSDIELKEGLLLLEEAGAKRGCLASGGVVDLNRVAAVVLDEFRGGKIGKISLEGPK